MDNQPVFTCRGTVIHGMRGHDKWVGNGNHLILRCTDTGDKGCFLYNISGSIIQFNPVAQLKRAHIRNHQPGNNITDHRTWTQRYNQSDKYRNPLEYPWIRTRQIRINHRNHKCVKQETDDMESRHCPIRIETVEFQTPCFYLTGQIVHQSYQIPHCIPDNNDCKQLGNIINNTHKNATDRVPDIIQYTISQSFCLRENNENQRNSNQ